MISAAAAVGDATASSVNDMLTTTQHIRFMTNIIVTPEFLNLEAPRLAKAVLDHIIAHADIVGEDPSGMAIMRFEFVCPPWLLDKLAAYGAADEHMEAEPDDCGRERVPIGLSISEA